MIENIGKCYQQDMGCRVCVIDSLCFFKLGTHATQVKPFVENCFGLCNMSFAALSHVPEGAADLLWAIFPPQITALTASCQRLFHEKNTISKNEIFATSLHKVPDSTKFESFQEKKENGRARIRTPTSQFIVSYAIHYTMASDKLEM